MWREGTRNPRTYTISHTNNKCTELITRAEPNWDERKCRKAATCDIFDLHLYVRNVERICGETSHFERKRASKIYTMVLYHRNNRFQYMPYCFFLCSFPFLLMWKTRASVKGTKSELRFVCMQNAFKKTSFFYVALVTVLVHLPASFLYTNWTCSNYRTNAHRTIFYIYLLVNLNLCPHLRVARQKKLTENNYVSQNFYRKG